MSTIKYSVPAIHCAHCVHTIEMELSEIEGVRSVRADMNSKEVAIEYGVPASEEMLVTTLKEIDYPPVINS